MVRILRFLKRNLFALMRKFWRALPVDSQKKYKLKSWLFFIMPWMFRHTRSYKDWHSSLPYILKQGLGKVGGVALGFGGDSYVPLLNSKAPEISPVRLICFYLPQFHPIPENNKWWGDGFTEWANVQPAVAQFEGHYQPHIPETLGYYNLLENGVQSHQVKLAKLYGVSGFCFYFYWFAGRRLLEAPIENYLNNSDLDLDFCLCWANENWSRRWDGLDKEILIAQEHSPEDDLSFIEHVAKYMRDSRYIRIDGKPLLLVYRPSLLPSPRETVLRWRDWCRSNGIGEIYLAYTQSFEVNDPEEYGFDAAVEFPPNNSSPPNITGQVTPLAEDFGGTVYDWRVFVERSKQYIPPNYTLFRGVCPSWDNTARRKNNGTIFLNSSPADYQLWLENAISTTVKEQSNLDERLVFINAWNEWAEGAHLEPDARFGYAWLQATRNALSGETYKPDSQRRIVLVAHDAYPHGAQMLIANLAKTLSQGMGFQVDLVCLGEGPLLSEYSKWATVHVLAGIDPRGPEARALSAHLYQQGHRSALVNTTVCGFFLETLSDQGIGCVALIHELKGVIEQNHLQAQATSISNHALKIVFPAIEVAESFKAIVTIDENKVEVRPQGLYKRGDKTIDKSNSREALRCKLNLPSDVQIVLGVGFADHRKGIDLFVSSGLAIANRAPHVRWVWIGHWDPLMQKEVEQQLAVYPEFKERFIFPGIQKNTDIFYNGSDVFALTSREDPFPSVVLEAMDAGLPVVGFENSGGFTGLLKDGIGRLVESGNSIAFGEAVAEILEQPDKSEAMGARGVELIAQRFSFRHYVFDLLDLLELGLQRVSVVVPNYNYLQYLPERLNSIIQQDYPIFEIIFLDDCSVDGSVAVAQNILSGQEIDFRVVVNTDNSGSVFWQWKRGCDLARGTHIWIAEADDSCTSSFLNETLKGFRTSGVVISYCESSQINERGDVIGNNYLEYVSDIDSRRWLTPFVLEGSKFADYFAVKNVIPNVSAVLFDADAVRSVLVNEVENVSFYKVAGDWLVYVYLLKCGHVAFTPIAANVHRRHQKSVTLSSINISQIEEIRGVQAIVSSEYQVSSKQKACAEEYLVRLLDEHGLSESSGN